MLLTKQNILKLMKSYSIPIIKLY